MFPPRPSPLPCLLLIMVATLTSAWPTPAAGQGGWLPTTWFTKSQTDPQAMYPLSEQNGPWLVLVTTFRGDGARDDARVHHTSGDYEHRCNRYNPTTGGKPFDPSESHT